MRACRPLILAAVLLASPSVSGAQSLNGGDEEEGKYWKIVRHNADGTVDCERGCSPLPGVNCC